MLWDNQSAYLFFPVSGRRNLPCGWDEGKEPQVTGWEVQMKKESKKQSSPARLKEYVDLTGPKMLWVRKDFDHSVFAFKSIFYPFTAVLIGYTLYEKETRQTAYWSREMER